MHESLSEKEKKNIVFLYISIDDNKDLWKNAVKNLELDKYTNGFSKGGWGSEVVQKFKITGIPRYMIINKNGEIVSKDAKRPSNPETITELLELAK
jgi:thioredoxin-related protein